MRRPNILVGVTALGFVLTSGVAAGQFFGVPVSDDVIVTTLESPSGKVYRVESRVGTAITIQSTLQSRQSYSLGFIANLDEAGRPTFTPYQLRDGSATVLDLLPGPNVVQQGENRSLLVPIGAAVQPLLIKRNPEAKEGNLVKFSTEEVYTGYFPDSPPFDFSGLQQGVIPQEIADMLEGQAYGVTTESICCILCGSDVVCAGSVTNGCGECSSGYRPRI